MKAPGLAFFLVAAACAPDAPAPPTAPASLVSGAPTLASTRNSDDDESAGSVSVDFERFAVGAIDGQFDWKSLGGLDAPPPADPLDTHCAVYDHAIQDNAALASPRKFERRSLRISNAVTTGCYGDQTFSARAADAAGQAGATTRSANGLVDYALPGGTLRNHFDAEWSFASAVPGTHQPGLEVVVSPARGDSHRMSWVMMTDLPDGLAVIFADRADPANPGAINQVTVARRLDRRKAHTVRLTMDFVDGPGNDVVRIYVDNDLRHTAGSWETYYQLEPGGAAQFGGNPPAVNRLMFRTGSDALRGIPGLPAPATLGFGFLIDDVRVSTFSVPHVEADCDDGGWRTLRDGDGSRFKNERDCARSVGRGD